MSFISCTDRRRLLEEAGVCETCEGEEGSSAECGEVLAVPLAPAQWVNDPNSRVMRRTGEARNMGLSADPDTSSLPPVDGIATAATSTCAAE